MDGAFFTGNTVRDAETIRRLFGGSGDLLIRHFRVNGKTAAGLCLDGMCDEERIVRAVTGPLTDPARFSKKERTAAQIRQTVYKGMDLKETKSPAQAAKGIAVGQFALLLEDETTAFLFAAQGFPRMGVTEAQSEQNEFGGREGFTDTLRDNITLLRRKMPTPRLKVEEMTAGETCPLSFALCYLPEKTDGEMLDKVRSKLKNTGADTLLGSGWLRPFLNGRQPALFPATGITERPDVLAYKLSTGRIAVLADGSPYAIIVPYLFTDYFHAPDDYVTGGTYAFFIRALRLLCFFVSVALPGLFVAVCDFHPNMLPADLMFKIASAEAQTPFPLALEAIAIHMIYEAVREAGMRMPKAAGHTVSIVGALVIGDAAVKAGLIAAPMLIVVGVTTVCAAVLSKLQDRIAVLRFLFIVAGGLTGFFGVFLGLGLTVVEICAVSPYAVPLSAPVSPFERRFFGNGIVRDGIKKLSRLKISIRELKF